MGVQARRPQKHACVSASKELVAIAFNPDRVPYGLRVNHGHPTVHQANVHGLSWAIKQSKTQKVGRYQDAEDRNRDSGSLLDAEF
jgi:hypothetical protein